MVYFIQSGHTLGPIKIGKAQNPAKRMADLQVANPAPLNLLLSIPGDRDEESRLHKIFKNERLRGEWFKASPTLLEHIERERARQAVEEAKAKYPGFPQFELISEDPTTLDKILTCRDYLKANFEPTPKAFYRPTTCLRVHLEGVFHELGYIGKAHLLVSYTMLGWEVGKFKGPYYDVKMKPKKGTYKLGNCYSDPKETDSKVVRMCGGYQGLCPFSDHFHSEVSTPRTKNLVVIPKQY